MNILTEPLPTSIRVSGIEIPIETDFRASVRFETMMCNPDITEENKVVSMLRLYFPQYIDHFDSVLPSDAPEYLRLLRNVDKTVQELIDFYRGGMPERIAKGGSGGKSQRVYAYDYDASYIYASFQQAYKIDLTTEVLHWWKFKALFYSLPDDTIIKQIMGHRVRKTSSDMSLQEKSHIRRMRSLYALPRNISTEEKEKEDKISEILMGNGDLSQLS